MPPDRPFLPVKIRRVRQPAKPGPRSPILRQEGLPLFPEGLFPPAGTAAGIPPTAIRFAG